MARAVLIAILAGVGLGTYGRMANGADQPVIHASTALGGPWLLVAFGVGALVASRAVAAAAGAGALVAGTITYYAISVLAQGVGHRYGAAMTVAWSAACVPIGGAFGWIGAVWRERRGALATAALTGALAGEALLLRAEWQRPERYAVLHVEVLVAVVLAVLLARRRAEALAWMVPMGLAFVAAEALVRTTLHGMGWGGI